MVSLVTGGCVLQGGVQTNDRLDKIDDGFGKIEDRLDKVEAEVRGVKTDVASLREELPSVLGDAMREVLREQRR